MRPFGPVAELGNTTMANPRHQLAAPRSALPSLGHLTVTEGLGKSSHNAAPRVSALPQCLRAPSAEGPHAPPWFRREES